MNTTLRKITNECFAVDLNKFYKKVGNYSIYRCDEKVKHYYYSHKICEVDLNLKTFYLEDCGFTGYKLTTAQLNFLQQYYINKGFKLLYRC